VLNGAEFANSYGDVGAGKGKRVRAHQLRCKLRVRALIWTAHRKQPERTGEKTVE